MESNMNTFRESFQKNGYLIIEDFNSHEECDALIQRAEMLANEFDADRHTSVFQTSDQSKTSDNYFLQSGNNISCFFEKDAFDEDGKLKNELFFSLNKIGHALHDLDPVFYNFSRSSQMQQLVKDLELQNWLMMQSMYIFKHAKIGGVVDVHQDSSFLYSEPESCIGFWFALEDANIHNGCLWAKPGGHQTSLRCRFRRKATGGTEMIALNDDPIHTEEMIPLEVKKGTCIVLHGLLPHYSLPNTSGRSRQAYAVHAIDKNASYPHDNWLQRNLLGSAQPILNNKDFSENYNAIIQKNAGS
jgi:phytanoyl-CoA hydroxylase